MFNFKRISILTLLVFASAGFSVLDDLNLPLVKNGSRLEAARRSRKSNKSNKTEKKSESKKESSSSEDDSGFLQDKDESKSYMPDIYRCPDCGYEQDEEGFCPDHSTLALVKIISNPKDPMAPNELDGNEDILVDVPLNIVFKKDEIESKTDNDSEKKDNKVSDNTKSKSSKKSKKSK